MNQIVRKLFKLQNNRRELLQNEYKLWYNVNTIIERKDDEYEVCNYWEKY